MNEKRPTHLDLFSGIGGFALAAERSGFQTVGFSEIDAFASAVLRKHWPRIPNYGDIRNVAAMRCDLVTAGFPCQDLSVAGKRKGLAGERSGLFFTLADVIEKITPAWFVLENVPGLLSSGKDMYVILRRLQQIGYCVCWRMLDAQYFGVAQRRRRVWFVGSLGNTRSVEVLFKQESGSRHDTTVKKMGPRGLCISTRDREQQRPTSETLVASTIRANDYSCGHRGFEKSNIVSQTIGSCQRGSSSFVWLETHIASPNAPREGKADGVSRGMDSARSRCLGNAIVPKVAEALLRGIRKLI